MTRKAFLTLAILCALFIGASAQSNPPLTWVDPDGTRRTNVTQMTVSSGTLTCSGSRCTLVTGGGGGGGAPTTATYITQTPDATLSAEQALSTLASGIMRVATTTGVVTSLTDSAGIAANISDETGTGALVFGTSPRLTTAILDSNGNELFGLTATASAVNEFTVANAATGNGPSLSATGGDANIPFNIAPKGTGNVVSTRHLQLNLNDGQFLAGDSATALASLLGLLANDGTRLFGGLVYGTTAGIFAIQDTGRFAIEAAGTYGGIGNGTQPWPFQLFPTTRNILISPNATAGAVDPTQQLRLVSGDAARIAFRVDTAASPTVAIADFTNNGSSRVTLQNDGKILQSGVTHANLGTPGNGTLTYCSDCTVTSGSDNTCAASGTGALAVRLNGAWRCFNNQN